MSTITADVRRSATTVGGSSPVAWIGLVAQLLCIAHGGVGLGATASFGGAMTSMCGSTAPAERGVSLSGWLHVIRNGELRFILLDDQGVAIHLVIDEALTRAFGGPRGLNQRRVTITGERAGGPPETVRVLTIELEGRNK